jgi:hypothetical protein
MLYILLLILAPVNTEHIEINDVLLIHLGGNEFRLSDGTPMKIFGSTNGRPMVVRMGEIEAGRKAKIEWKGKRYLWKVHTLKVNGKPCKKYTIP